MAQAGRSTLRRRVPATLASLAPSLLRLLRASLRIEIVGAENLRDRRARGARAIPCCRHTRLRLRPVVAAGAAPEGSSPP